MKSIILRLVLVLAAFAFVPDAMADSTGGNIFVDARFGAEFGRKADSGNSSNDSNSIPGADAGYRWKLDDQRALGFELGYIHFGNFDEEGGNQGRSTTSAKAIGLGGNLQVLFGEDRAWIFQGRAGLMRAKFHEDITDFFGPDSSDSWSQNGVYFGLGVGRKIFQGFSVTLAYSHYGASNDARLGRPDLDLNWIGLVAEYQF